MSKLYEVELEPEVAAWLDGLSDKHFGKVDDATSVLAELGPATPIPLARPLRDGVRELRLTLGDVEARITYWITTDRRIIFLTWFRKTRQHEEKQINRAVAAQRLCEAEHGPAHDVFDREPSEGAPR
ncbi:type II toxin-antitoxin system RelE/ParE family toxin [Streptomyces sp. NPDC087440]|uniref:type II toxin-antitoxin system RelE/ParE family toxin n=1 Tax=Streptomyces sp. NPDC087440 TaxID=3365790 RepID=UPI00382F2DD6